MKLSTVWVLAGILNAVAASSPVRGVSPKDQALYKPNAANRWRCLNHPEIELSFDQINDEYCDCPDGSDEPGTAACGSLLNLPTKFYCANEGHLPGYVETHKVNDGVCDYETCCDGSEEWKGVGGVVCPNKCAAIHQKYVAATEARDAVVRRGLAEKTKLTERAKVMKAKSGVEVKQLKQEIAAKRLSLTSLEEAHHLARNSVKAIFDREVEQRIQMVRAALTQQQAEHDTLGQRVAYLENLLGQLSENYNPNFNDLVVKETVQNYQDYVVNKEAKFTAATTEVELLTQLEASLKEITLPQAAAPFSLRAYVHNQYQAWVRAFMGLKPPQPTAVDASGAPDDSQILAVRKELESAESRLGEQETLFAGDRYGAEGIFHGLQDKCVSNKVGEYDYEVCFTGKIHQNGHGSNVAIGSFAGVEYGADGTTVKVLYEDGAQCWNGPRRRGIVTIECADQFEVVSVTEPEKCEYHFLVRAPLGCFPEQLARAGETVDVGRIVDEL